MDKKLIQQLLDDDETRVEIAIAIGHAVDANDDANDDGSLYDGLMINALNELNDTLVEGDMVTIEVSDHMWVRGNYLYTTPDGQLVVMAGDWNAWCKKFEGKRVDLVIKGEEGETT
jgi:hypothetical protein